MKDANYSSWNNVGFKNDKFVDLVLMWIKSFYIFRELEWITFSVQQKHVVILCNTQMNRSNSTQSWNQTFVALYTH